MFKECQDCKKVIKIPKLSGKYIDLFCPFCGGINLATIDKKQYNEAYYIVNIVKSEVKNERNKNKKN